jgi:predicted small metal-binding protein
LLLAGRVATLTSSCGTGSEGSKVAKETTCPPCGEVLRGENDDELVGAVIEHAKVHGHELGEVNREQILSEAREV